MVRFGELNHSVIWSDHLGVSSVQVTDMAPDNKVETARR